jgi:hypothetical protein
VALTPAEHPDFSALMVGLGAALQVRFEHAGGADRPIRSITVREQALAATSGQTSELGGRLANLASALRARPYRGGTDLDRAITVGEGALALTPAGHLDRRLSTRGQTAGHPGAPRRSSTRPRPGDHHGEGALAAAPETPGACRGWRG